MMSYLCTTLVVVFAVFYWYRAQRGTEVTFDCNLNTTYDYIIVGAGSSGAVVANRLSEDPNVTVLLLEAGGSDIGNDFIRIPIMVGGVFRSKEDWLYHTVPQKHSHKATKEQRSYWPRGRVLGGSSSINLLVYVRGSQHDFNQWEAEGCTGWSYKDVLPYFLKIEDIQIPELYNSSYHSQGGYLPISKIHVTPLPGILQKAASQIGLDTVDVNGEDMIGYSYVQSNIMNGERYSTSRAYLRPVVHRPNLHISVNSFVTKIIIKNKRAVGVEMVKDNKKLSVYAKHEVIVSAGAVNSPQLLMLSGIGPRQHLHEHKIPVIADLPVGENLEDHLMFWMKYKINQSYPFNLDLLYSLSERLWYEVTGKGSHSFSGNEGNIFGKSPERTKNGSNWPDYQITLYSVAQDESFIDQLETFVNIQKEVKEKLKTRGTKTEFTMTNILLHPKSRGTIRLKSSDPYDHPFIDPNYLDSPYDVRVLIDAIRKTQEITSTPSLQKIGVTLNRMDFKGLCDGEVFDTDQYWECILRHFAMTVYHPVATCRMGALDDKTAVVDPELRVKGIKGLRVVDCSVLRSEPSGNTNAPCIMVGEKAADLIRNKDTVAEFRRKTSSLKL